MTKVRKWTTPHFAAPLWFNPAPEGFPWYDFREILIERSQMVIVGLPNGMETLPKISIGQVGCTNVTHR